MVTALNKTALPDWLLKQVEDPKTYKRWLDRKAVAHFRRAKKRGNTTATKSAYKQAIHDAVIASKGRDAYTGEKLDWSLISQYDNDKSKELGRAYKKGLAALPTLDHVDNGLGKPNFVISSWRTNDAKHDLTSEEFLTLTFIWRQSEGQQWVGLSRSH